MYPHPSMYVKNQNLNGNKVKQTVAIWVTLFIVMIIATSYNACNAKQVILDHVAIIITLQLALFINQCCMIKKNTCIICVYCAFIVFIFCYVSLVCIYLTCILYVYCMLFAFQLKKLVQTTYNTHTKYMRNTYKLETHNRK